MNIFDVLDIYPDATKAKYTLFKQYKKEPMKMIWMYPSACLAFLCTHTLF